MLARFKVFVGSYYFSGFDGFVLRSALGAAARRIAQVVGAGVLTSYCRSIRIGNAEVMTPVVPGGAVVD